MSREKKVYYRTSPFHAPERIREDFIFWIMEPSAEKTGFQIKHFYMGHAAGIASGGIDRIADALTEKEALMKMHELERAAAAKYKKIDDADDDNAAKLGIEYSKARHYAPAYEGVIAGMNLDALKQKSHKPPKIRF